ncbi:hypothetical protein V1517DRAFT_356096 [Lipomyces orientalis]|uniref:Uncharacterized protein n=1 Tax=Lipomyces orientalis TaxID=1233043 RepID=A0ACC3TGD0_9ASCO
MNEFQCTMCNHAPFDTKVKLSKHSSSRHRTAETFTFGGVSCPLTVTDDNKYVCPEYKAQISSVRNLRRNMAQLRSWIRATQRNTRQSMETIDAEVHSGIPEISKDDCTTIIRIGFIFNPTSNVLICNRCHYIVYKSMVVTHLTKVHNLKIADERATFSTTRSYIIRPHLAIVWDDLIEEGLGESDDDYSVPRAFALDAFRPGQAAVDGIPVLDGVLTHRCVQSKETMRTHYRRNHDNQVVEFCPVRVQAFYSRSSVNQHGIPANVHSVPASHAAMTDKRDLNKFGIYFFAYKHPKSRNFELLKRISLKILHDSRRDTTAGYQVMLTKIIVEGKKRFCYPVQLRG